MSVDAQLPEIIPVLYKNAPAFRQRLDGVGLKPADPLLFRLEVTAIPQIPPAARPSVMNDHRSSCKLLFTRCW